MPSPRRLGRRLAASPRTSHRYGDTLGFVSQALVEPPHLPPATKEQVRSHAAELIELAARHGITNLAFASPGRVTSAGVVFELASA